MKTAQPSPTPLAGEHPPGLPLILVAGAFVFALGVVEDLAYHLAPVAVAPALETVLGVDGELAHLAIFAGMLLIVAGLIALGLRAGRRSETRPFDRDPGTPFTRPAP